MSIDPVTRTDPTSESAHPTRTVTHGTTRDVSRQETTRARNVLGIVGIAAVAVATLGAVSDDAEGSTIDTVRVVMETGRSQDEPVGDPRSASSIASTAGATELDVRGIPTWWSAAGAATGPDARDEVGHRLAAAGSGGLEAPTELDQRGVPTWWTAT